MADMVHVTVLFHGGPYDGGMNEIVISRSRLTAGGVFTVRGHRYAFLPGPLLTALHHGAEPSALAVRARYAPKG